MFNRHERNVKSYVNALLAVTMIWASLSLQGCLGVFSPGIDVQESTTSSSGQVEFSSSAVDGRVVAVVEDHNGQPLENIWVKMVADKNQIVLLAVDPQGRYLPAMRAVEAGDVHTRLESKSVLWTVVSLVMIGVAVVSAIHEFVTSPPRVAIVEVGGGSQKRCLVGDFRDVVAVLGVGGPLAGGKIAAIKYGGAIGKRVEVVIGAGALVADVLSKLSRFMGKERRVFCWNETITGPDGKPAYVEIGPIDADDITGLPHGVETELIATGRTRGHVADLRITNHTSERQHVLIYPGISFINTTSPDRQDVTVIRTASVVLEPGEESSMAVRGACINLHKPPPWRGDRFVPVVEQRPDLVALGQAIDRLNPAEGVAQDAVWVITDDKAPSSQNLEKVRRLFITAGLDPDAYPAIRRTAVQPVGEPRKK